MIITITDIDEITALVNLRPFQLPPYWSAGNRNRGNSSTIQLQIEESEYQRCLQAIQSRKCYQKAPIGAFSILQKTDLQTPAGRLLLAGVSDGIPALIVS
jgi:hypothetical protein